METVEVIREKQKITFKLIVGIAVGIIILGIVIILVAGRNKDVSTESTKRLLEQNEQLQKSNQSLISNVNRLSDVIENDKRKDSLLLDQFDETSRILPGINQNISNLKNQYEKGSAISRNYDVVDVQQYIASEARRIRAEQTGRSQAPD